MFATFYADGQRLGMTRVRKEILPALQRELGARPYTRLGLPGLKLTSSGRPDADQVRKSWTTLVRFIDNTGYAAKVETTEAENRALLTYGLVTSGVGTYRIVLSEGRIAILSGHGSVS